MRWSCVGHSFFTSTRLLSRKCLDFNALAPLADSFAFVFIFCRISTKILLYIVLKSKCLSLLMLQERLMECNVISRQTASFLLLLNALIVSFEPIRTRPVLHIIQKAKRTPIYVTLNKTKCSVWAFYPQPTQHAATSIRDICPAASPTVCCCWQYTDLLLCIVQCVLLKGSRNVQL